jgi:hypothetical protein
MVRQGHNQDTCLIPKQAGLAFIYVKIYDFCF